MGAKAINLLYVHSSSIGYGAYGTNLAEALKALQVDVYDDLPGRETPEWDRETEHLANTRGLRSGIAEVVCWISTPTHARGWYRNQRPMLSTMWESMTLPESFRETLHEFGTVIVPSVQNVELFSQYHGDVRLCYLGVDPSTWHYTKRTPPGAFFDFLIAGSGPRKGTDLAYKAFLKVFGKNGSWPQDGPIPRLVMKTPRAEDFYHERVQIIGGRISTEAEVALYETAHCYIQPSRGEGFGLMPLQAIAQGCPTILTDAHGHKAYSHLGLGISAKPSQAAYFIYGDAGEWWEPSLDELCDRMKWVYDNWEQATFEAYHNSQNVLSHGFTWEHCAKRFLDIIGDSQPLKNPGEWYAPTLQMFPIVTITDWQCDIAGSHYQFRQGKEYWETADVKRILFEAGLLDPICFRDGESGLLPQQIERYQENSARYENCQLCGQKLHGEVRV